MRLRFKRSKLSGILAFALGPCLPCFGLSYHALSTVGPPIFWLEFFVILWKELWKWSIFMKYLSNELVFFPNSSVWGNWRRYFCLEVSWMETWVLAVGCSSWERQPHGWTGSVHLSGWWGICGACSWWWWEELPSRSCECHLLDWHTKKRFWGSTIKGVYSVCNGTDVVVCFEAP